MQVRNDEGLRLSMAAADAFVAYDWPGDVRELERLIRAHRGAGRLRGDRAD
jgi:transcriptional regulator of acetoin/glycerol metabolism